MKLGEIKMGILGTVIGVIVLLSIGSAIYAEGDTSLTIENAKDFGQKLLDTINIWRSE